MFQTIHNNLQEVIDLLYQIDDNIYTKKHKMLSDATIGQHTRHIIELFECLITQYEQNIVNYEDRKRDKTIENDKNAAIKTLIWVQNNIEKPNKNIDLIIEFGDMKQNIPSNYWRELVYNLEHCIHHQALIKVGLMDFPNITLPRNFGIASSTIRYRELCVQ